MTIIGIVITSRRSGTATVSRVGPSVIYGLFAALGSLHTIVTIALVRVVLKEHLQLPQRIGVALTLTAVVAIPAG